MAFELNLRRRNIGSQTAFTGAMKKTTYNRKANTIHAYDGSTRGDEFSLLRRALLAGLGGAALLGCIQDALATAATAEVSQQTFVYVKDFGAVGDGITDDSAAIVLAIAALKTSGGGTLLFEAKNYYLTPAISEHQAFFKIDFPNVTLQMEKGGQLTLGRANHLSYLFYITRGKFKANGIKLVCSDGSYLDSYGKTGTRLFTLTDDDSVGINDIYISNCSAYEAAAFCVGFPKRGKGISQLVVNSCYAESCTYGICLNNQTAGDGPISDVIIKSFKVKNVYRGVFIFGYSSNVSIDIEQQYGHAFTALGNGTTVNVSLPKVMGYKHQNITINSVSDEDWSRGVLLSAQTDSADIASGGNKYANRAFNGIKINSTCARGSYADSTDYTAYIGHINTETYMTVSSPIGVAYNGFYVNINSPSDLSKNRYPIFTSFTSTTQPVGMIMKSTADFSSSSQPDTLKDIERIWDVVQVNGRVLVSRP